MYPKRIKLVQQFYEKTFLTPEYARPPLNEFHLDQADTYNQFYYSVNNSDIKYTVQQVVKLLDSGLAEVLNDD